MIPYLFNVNVRLDKLKLRKLYYDIINQLYSWQSAVNDGYLVKFIAGVLRAILKVISTLCIRQFQLIFSKVCIIQGG